MTTIRLPGYPESPAVYGGNMPNPEIVAHYNVYEEAERLAEAGGRLEFLRTTEIIRRHLRPPPGVVADVGGGPGVYTGWLAQMGYRVHMFDIVPRHVEAARATNAPEKVTAELADAREVPMTDNSADAVLLLGPLYHLVDHSERIKALVEARRILRPDGFLLAAGISRFASAIDGAHRDFLADPAFRRIVEQALADGQHRNPTDDLRYFTTAFFHHPDEMHQEVLDAGFAEVEVLAVEGIGWTVPKLDEVLDSPGARDRLLDILRRLEAEPSLLGASPHILAVGSG